MTTQEGIDIQRIAVASVKFFKAIEKKNARATTLSRWTLAELREQLHRVDQNDHYSHVMIKRKNKRQLIDSILEEEGYEDTVNTYAEELEERGINTIQLGQVASFGV